ncbi:FRG domain-containing protein [Dehalobacter sp.]|uniref:FRG domain-containing protein n=1 Tax=Dehalobacter sp. TaxID=1962289 RepID=UPI00258B75BE|nr:FRG domain-containing protein [Dehalobacter sp.]MDJ0304743.1 FRG domain-containing protein [Dehalobacter sp.]
MSQANSVSKYKEILTRYKSYKNILFRGQKNKNWDISCSLARDEGFLNNESTIISEVIAERQSDFANNELPIEYLAKMQHYGLPTRLVDLTISELCALYFAVEDDAEKSDGIVYVFVDGKLYHYNDIEIHALSLLAFNEKSNISELCSKYYKKFDSKIEESEFLDICRGNYIIKPNNIFANDNDRLLIQQGTFLICGNTVSGGKIINSINAIDRNQATETILIPYEYKKSIRDELDSLGISSRTVYPELPTYAEHIKQKFAVGPERKVDCKVMYKIHDVKDISTRSDKRLSISIVLDGKYEIEMIKKAVYDVIEKKMRACSVIWIYVALNDEYLVMSNWILRALWVSDSAVHKPIELKEKESKNISWDFNENFQATQEMLSDAFEDDKYLFVCNLNFYFSIKEEFDILNNYYLQNDISSFVSEICNGTKKIRERYFHMQDLGRSRNPLFDEYLELFQSLISTFDEIASISTRNESLENKDFYLFRYLMSDMTKSIKLIEEQKLNWKNKINVTDSDMATIKYVKKEKIYKFNPTIPINENGLKVDFDLNIIVDDDKKVIIQASTNLFDDAELMISINKNKRLFAQDKVKIENGKFKSAKFTDKGNGYESGDYSLEILLPIASVQPKSFVEKAGIEYENLIGEFVERSGVSPIVKYSKNFKI